MADAVKGAKEQPGKIGGANAKRTPKKKVLVVSKTGDREYHLPANAADLVNHLGWSYGVEQADNATEEVEDSVVEAEAKADAKDPDLVELEALRAEAEGLGVVVDKRWGKKSLREAIDKAKELEGAE